MKAIDSKHKWGGDVERLVHWLPSGGKKNVYKAEELLPGRSIVYVEEKGRFYIAKVGTIEIGDGSSNDKSHIQLDIPNSEPIIIKCHLETIPYGFDAPTRYELVVDTDIETFELLGDYDDVKRTARKEAALIEFTRNDDKLQGER